MKRKKLLFLSIFQLAVFVLFSSSVLAIPMAEISYIESDLGNGNFQYEYILANTSDPVLDAGYDIFDFTLEFDLLTTLTIDSLPPNWFSIDGSGFVVSIADFGEEIPPGDSQSGFIFQFDDQVGDLPFLVSFTNPISPYEPVIVGGTTAPVPEPASLAMWSMMGGIGFVARRKRKRSQTA